jgi:hypothetical protein
MLPCYTINEKFWQNQLFLVLGLVFVAGWLWRLHKQEQTKEQWGFGVFIVSVLA